MKDESDIRFAIDSTIKEVDKIMARDGHSDKITFLMGQIAALTWVIK